MALYNLKEETSVISSKKIITVAYSFMKISDDYLDELCRRAAELYPLKIRSINWNRIFNHIKNKPVSGYRVIRFVTRKLDKH